ncbi:ATP-binding cassette domain-containing protein [Lautropia mirabilis]|uniref:ATP-binding cassette domain-containing protein n=1 Tax=Lautropia mirabilis TaxID=47671 RepID=UPI0028895AF2|nr:ATP-binding cassette domain-containing protein [Lautropia mirabilis]
MRADESVVRAEGLTRRFTGPDGRPLVALDRVSLSVPRGQLTALVGPDGAGKTTLMRMMAGLLAPDEGSLHVLGLDVTRDAQAVQDRISYMPQRFGLYEDLSVQENLDLYADLHGVPQAVRRERFARLMAMTDLARFTARPAGKLSGGMKQKLGLACTLVRSPELLLLDEPSVGVDPLSRRDLWEILLQLVRDEQLSVVVSTAYMDEAERCTHVHVMNAGHVLANGTPQALAQRAQGLTFVATPPVGMAARMLQARLLDAASAAVDAVPRGGQVRFIRRPDVDEAALRPMLENVEVHPRPAELEDAFMLMLRQHAEAAGGQSSSEGLPAAGADRTLQGRRNDEPTAPAAVTDHAEPVIVVRDLVRRFGDFTAVASTSFEVRRGEIFGLLGPNGAGKTTTFRMLCGLLPATSGSLQVAGANLRVAPARARARIGYVAQKFSLYATLTVRENLAFYGAAYGLHGRQLTERIEAMLQRFDLDPAAESGLLPAGYRQRLAMAAGLIHAPDILFLDEPTSGIDPLARRAFWRTITVLSAQGVTIVITTHFMEEAEYCDRIAIQDAGRMLALGTPRDVRTQAGEAGSDMNAAFIAIVERGRREAVT